MKLKFRGDIAKKLENLGVGIKHLEELVLHPIEAYYFANEANLDKEEALREVRRLGLENVLKVYEELRSKGYILMFLENDIRVLRKGFRKGEDRTYAIIKVTNPNELVSWGEVSKFVAYASALRKNAILAIVGENIHYISLGTIRFD